MVWGDSETPRLRHLGLQPSALPLSYQTIIAAMGFEPHDFSLPMGTLYLAELYREFHHRPI